MLHTGGHEERRATLAALAEVEVEAGDDFAGTEPVDQDRLDEILRRALREFPIERIFDHRLEAHGFEDAGAQ